MKLLAFLTETFINTFGITRPSPGQEKRTELILGGFLLTVLVLAFGIVAFLVYNITSR
jgi:hypothetical protein